jgi:hypothetical protein
VSNRRHRREPVDIDPPVIERAGFWARLAKRLGLAGPSGAVCVAELTNRAEADVIAGFLTSHGIHARVLGDDVGGMAPYMQAPFGVRVLVPAAHAAEAQRLIAEVND